MSNVVTLRLNDLGGLAVNVDLMALEAPMKAALHNATIYLGYVIHSTSGEPLSSVSLDSLIELDVGVANPIPVETRKEYQDQFSRWAIGQALTEIDQSYQRFLAASLEAKADLVSFRDHRKLAQHRPNLANTWSAHEQFFNDAPSRDRNRLKDAEYLRTLGNARNCLAHDSGLVTKRRLTDGDAMPVRWPGRDMYQEAKDGRRKLLPRDRPFTVAKSDVGKTLKVKQVVRSRIYKLGQLVSFSGTNLAEIIFFYQILAMSVGGEMHRFTEELGHEMNADQRRF